MEIHNLLDMLIFLLCAPLVTAVVLVVFMMWRKRLRES